MRLEEGVASCVEDHGDPADASAELLRDRGHEARIAATVAGALAAAKEGIRSGLQRSWSS